MNKQTRMFIYGMTVMLVIFVGYLVYTGQLSFDLRKPESPSAPPAGSGRAFYLKFYVQDALNSSKTISNAEIRIYKTPDASDDPEIITTNSDGYATTQDYYMSGSVVYVQAFASGYYTTPLTAMTVSTLNFTIGATVKMPTIKMYKISSTVTISATNGTYSLSDNMNESAQEWVVAQNSLSLTITISGIETNTRFGSGTYTDYRWGRTYKGPIVVIYINDTSTLSPLAGWDAAKSAGTYAGYYAYIIDPIDNSYWDSTDGTYSFTINFDVLKSAGVKMSLYVYDTAQDVQIDQVTLGTADDSIVNAVIKCVLVS
ncbi:MAG: hypothetical protein Q6363_007865 [Candidatus Njordarchaeota archaeon]